MNLELNQVATYWDPSTDTDRYGKPIFSAPTQLQVRWEDRTQTIQSKTGEEITSRSRVFLGQDVNIDGYLFLGTSNATDPTKVDKAYEIQTKTTTPDLSNLESLTTVYL